jgi:hypothetical protein
VITGYALFFHVPWNDEFDTYLADLMFFWNLGIG